MVVLMDCHVSQVFSSKVLSWLQDDDNLTSCGYANVLHHYGKHVTQVYHLFIDGQPTPWLPSKICAELKQVATSGAWLPKDVHLHLASIEVHMNGDTEAGPLHKDLDESTPVLNVVIPLNELYDIHRGGSTVLVRDTGKFHLDIGTNDAKWFDGRELHMRGAATSADAAKRRRVLFIVYTPKRITWKALATPRRLHTVACRALGNNGLPPVHVITLGGERQTLFFQWMRDAILCDIEVQVANTYDGPSLAKSKCTSLGKLGINLNGATPTDGMLGCLLSHRELWMRLAAHDDDDTWWIIFEDDARPTQEWCGVVKTLKQRAQSLGVDFVFLYHGDAALRDDKFRCRSAGKVSVNGRSMQLSYPRPVYSTAAYMLSARAARIMLSNMSHDFFDPDDITWLSYTRADDLSSNFEAKWASVTQVYDNAVRLMRDKLKQTFKALICDPMPVMIADVGSATFESSSIFSTSYTTDA